MEQAKKAENICNYCKLKRLRKFAKARGHYVRVRPAQGGVNLYETPDCNHYYNLKVGYPDHDKYYVETLSSIPDHCVC